MGAGCSRATGVIPSRHRQTEEPRAVVAVRGGGRRHLRRGLVRSPQGPAAVAGDRRPAADWLHWGHPAGSQLHLEVSINTVAIETSHQR